MSDPQSLNGNGNGSRAERAAENAIFKLVARVAMIAVLPLGGWLGGEVWATARKTSDLVIELKGKIDGYTYRLDALDRRNDTQDARIEDLQRRVYPLSKN
ncbi:MAG: hypothetical protein K9G48_08995 [Reyranella sp.]|nr:hypothetical protein [Reyranella sp.]